MVSVKGPLPRAAPARVAPTRFWARPGQNRRSASVPAAASAVTVSPQPFQIRRQVGRCALGGGISAEPSGRGFVRLPWEGRPVQFAGPSLRVSAVAFCPRCGPRRWLGAHGGASPGHSLPGAPGSPQGPRARREGDAHPFPPALDAPTPAVGSLPGRVLRALERLWALSRLGDGGSGGSPPRTGRPAGLPTRPGLSAVGQRGAGGGRGDGVRAAPLKSD